MSIVSTVAAVIVTGSYSSLFLSARLRFFPLVSISTVSPLLFLVLLSSLLESHFRLVSPLPFAESIYSFPLATCSANVSPYTYLSSFNLTQPPGDRSAAAGISTTSRHRQSRSSRSISSIQTVGIRQTVTVDWFRILRWEPFTLHGYFEWFYRAILPGAKPTEYPQCHVLHLRKLSDNERHERMLTSMRDLFRRQHIREGPKSSQRNYKLILKYKWRRKKITRIFNLSLLLALTERVCRAVQSKRIKHRRSGRLRRIISV